MNQKRLWIAAAIIAVVIVIGFVVSVPHTTRDTMPSVAREKAPPVPVVAIRDVYKKGVHTLSGSFTAPNACATASTTASLAASSIMLEVALAGADGVCLELPTTLSFKATLAAPAGLPVVVTVNGREASTTPL